MIIVGRFLLLQLKITLSLLFPSSSPTATALTDAMSESVPFFFCSDFLKEIFCRFELKKIIGGSKI